MMSHSRDKKKFENLKKLRRDELEEILIGEEKLLSNQKLLKSLPDKGKKIIEYVGQIRLALQYHDEEERQQSAARTKLKSRLHQEQSVSREAAAETMEMAAAAAASGDSDLVDSLEMMSMSGKDTDLCSSSIQTTNIPEDDNYFLKTHEKKNPHRLNVLEKIENINPSRKPKFKTNQIPQWKEISAHGRRAQDHKHLRDVTAATLPPIQHGGAVVLSLEESANLLQEQTRKRRELEAKMAAQKLSRGLKISMETYSPDDGPMTSYREVLGEEDHNSSDED